MSDPANIQKKPLVLKHLRSFNKPGIKEEIIHEHSDFDIIK